MIYNVRLLKAKDAGQYRTLRLESLKAHPEAFGARHQEQAKLKKLFFEGELERDDSAHKVIGVFKLNKLAGFCTLSPSGKYAELDQMYVRPRQQGKKLAVTLLDFAVEIARENNCKALRLAVRIANKRALKVYQDFGFSIMDKHHGPKGHVMEYALPPLS